MKKIFVLLTMVILFVSCANVATHLKKDGEYFPKNENEEPVLIYIQGENHLPDSSVYVGSIITSMRSIVNQQELAFIGFMFAPIAIPMSHLVYDWNISNSISKNAKKLGGNLVLIETNVAKLYTNGSKDIEIKGKVFNAKIPNTKSAYTIDSVFNLWEERPMDDLEGIYEIPFSTQYRKSYIGALESYVTPNLYRINNDKYKLTYAVVKENNKYLLVYLKGFEYDALSTSNSLVKLREYWKEGDIMAYFIPTAKKNLFEAPSYHLNKYYEANSMMKREQGNLILTNSTLSYTYNKVYPDSSRIINKYGSCTSFAINSNTILSCYLPISDAKSDDRYKIMVKGINGDFENSYEAFIEHYDSKSNLAILKLKDNAVTINYEPLPVVTKESEIGTPIILMGFPLANAMGDEIKISNGIISSQSGYANSPNEYQISAPFQRGSHGSPTFDEKGNLIGIATSGIMSADNVAYTLKMQHINDFLSKNNVLMPILETDKFSSLTDEERLAKTQKNILLIELVSTEYLSKKK